MNDLQEFVSNELATVLDIAMLLWGGATIYSEDVDITQTPTRTGAEVSQELGGRLLLRFVPELLVTQRTASGVATYGGESGPVWCTPTPYSPIGAIKALALPFPDTARTHVILLDPTKITEVQGPHRVSYGTGLEYYLPKGYSEEALVLKWPRRV